MCNNNNDSNALTFVFFRFFIWKGWSRRATGQCSRCVQCCGGQHGYTIHAIQISRKLFRVCHLPALYPRANVDLTWPQRTLAWYALAFIIVFVKQLCWCFGTEVLCAVNDTKENNAGSFIATSKMEMPCAFCLFHSWTYLPFDCSLISFIVCEQSSSLYIWSLMIPVAISVKLTYSPE